MDTEGRTPTISDDPETMPDAPDEAQPVEPTNLLGRVKGSWRSLSVSFGVGILLGWLVLGWLIFPVKWVNTDPWDLRSQCQERYLSLVAEDYWRTADLRRVMTDLEGWDEKALARRLASMEARESNPETRQHIAALAEALKLPQAAQPFWASLFGQKAVLFSMILSALPMMVAVVLAFSSFVKRAPAEEETLEELAEEEAALSVEEAEIAVLIETQPSAAQGEGQKPEEGKKAEQAITPEATEEQNDVTDLLTNLFDDDNESLEHLQALSKGLGDVNVDSLLKSAHEIVNNLVRVHMLRSQAA